MEILQELPSAPPTSGAYLTIGVFDGVHRGHQHLLRRVAELAANAGVASGAVTFLNHPREVLQPSFQAQYLTSPAERLELLKACGMDWVAPVTFDLPLSQLSAGEFLGLLQERLRMRGLVVGPDFALGKGREGDVARLRDLSGAMGFHLEVVPLQLMGDELMRSTTVRRRLLEGDVGRAREMLGRIFSLQGSVVYGEGRGRGLGFPTANVEVPSGRVVPKDGVYATWVVLDDVRLPSATSVGVRPTFGGGERTVEAYIFDFDADLYGRSIRLEFVHRLRDELAFSSVDALRERMTRDVEETRKILAAEGVNGSSLRQRIAPAL